MHKGIVEDFVSSQKGATRRMLAKRGWQLRGGFMASGLGYSGYFGYPFGLAVGTVVVAHR